MYLIFRRAHETDKIHSIYRHAFIIPELLTYMYDIQNVAVIIDLPHF